MTADPDLRRRIRRTLAAILALDLLFAGIAAALLVPWLRPLGDALAAPSGFAPLPWAVLWLAITVQTLMVLVLGELRYAHDRVLADLDAREATDESHPDLLARVRRLAAQADVTEPTVAVVDSDVPNSLMVGGLGQLTLVVSEGLLAELEGDQLDAVLAHELAHRLNRDATVMTVASLLPSLIEDPAESTGGLRSNPLAWLGTLVVAFLAAAAVIDAPIGSPAYVGVFVALVVATFVVGSVALGVLAAPVTVLARRLSRDRELAADRAGAILAGDPAALADALRTLTDEDDRPQSDLRSRATTTLCLLPNGFEGGGARTGDDGFSVETRSHPPVEERVEILQSVAREMEA